MTVNQSTNVDNETDLDDEETDDTESATDSGATNANKELREHNKRLAKENAALRARVLATDLSALGLDPEKGLGKALSKEYQGELTVEALAEYAKTEYGHEAQVEQTPPAVQAADRAAQLQSQGQPVTPPSEPDKVQEADRKLADPDATRQDAQRSISEKLTQFTETHYPNRQQ